MQLSIVSPIYKGEKMLDELVRRITMSVTTIADEYEIISLLSKPYILQLSLVICFIAFVLSLKVESLLLNPLFSVILFICLAYCSFKGGDCKTISVLSKVSYEFYLWQGLSILVVCDVFEFRNIILAIPLCLFLNFIMSCVAQYFNKEFWLKVK